MRRFTVLCFLSVFMCVIFAPRAWADVAINETNFPDATFRQYVSDNCDTDYNGNLSDEEIAAVTDITVGGGISNLKGIEYFTALTMLNCENNQLTELDVSKNTALKDLYCDNNQLTALNVSNNPALEYLSCYNNQLAELDVSSSTALEKLYCDNNQLTALDVSKNTKLTYLSCHDNQLTELDVSNNPALEELECYGNQLTALDVSSSTALKELECYSNQLTALDVSNNTKLTNLTCYSNQLTALDVSKNTALEELYCSNNKLTALDVSNNSALQTLYCYYNQLTALDVSSSTALNDLQCYRNQLTALDVSKNTNLTYLYCYSNQLTALDVSKNTALQQLYCSNNKLTALDVSKNTNLTYLNCSSNQLTALDVSKNSNLSNLECNGQNTSGSNIIYTGDATYPYEHIFSWDISADKIANISDVAAKDSSDAAITVSYADGTARFASLPSTVTYNYATGKTAMDVTMSDFSLAVGINATIFPDEKFRAYVSDDLDTYNDGYLSEEEIAAVTGIDVNTQGISSLKGVEYFTALTDLRCYNNQLTELDVSKNTKLTYLTCDSNQLTELDVSNNTALQTLSCYYNQLTALDVSNNTAITYLNCSNNQLTALDLSKNTALKWLHCYGNQLTALDVSKNTALEYLFCTNNQLTALDVSKNTALIELDCGNNQLTALDVSNNTALTGLACAGQKVSGFSVIFTGDTSSPYKIDFSGYISTGNFTNISDFTAKDSNDAEITATYADGVAQFASLPSTVTYNYATGNSKWVMDVTMSDFSLFIEINATIFPDGAFRAYITENFDSDNDGYLSEEEMTAIKATTFLDVSGQRISSLKGIELFTGLKILYCNDNQLTELDVSNNTALTRLNCNNNKIATLDVSNNTALTYLNCGRNQMTSLDVSNNTALTYLNCANNQLAGLDISNCTSLAPDYLTADSDIIITHGTRDGLPSFTDHSLILSGQLGLDFYANVPASTNTNGAYTDFTVNDKTGSPEMFSNADKVGDDYRFTCYINSVQMADTITAMFCYSNDTRNMAAVQDCRVTDYLDAIISSTDLSAKSPDLVALAEAIKDYGHYVQIPLSRYNSWDIGTDHAEIECVNKNIDSDSADVKTKLQAYALSKDIEGSGIEKLTYDLELDSEITLNIYLTPGNDAGNVSAYITDDYGDFDGKTNMAVYDPSENAYVVTIGGISAHKLGRFYTVSITTGKGSGFTVKMSALSYANGVMQAENDGENIDDDLKRAVISLYKYYIATMTYRDPTFTE